MARTIRPDRLPGWRRPAPVLAAAVLAAGGFLAVFAAVHDRLPTELATHFTADGTADGVTGRGAFAVFVPLLVLGQAALFAVLGHRARGSTTTARLLTATGAGTAAFLGHLMVALTLANAGGDDPHAVHFPGWHAALALATGVLAGALGYALAGTDPAASRTADGPPPTSADRLPLAPREHLVWSRTVDSPGLWGIGAVSALATVPLSALVSPWALLPTLATGVLAAATARVRVTADARGLTVTPALLPRPRLHVPLAQIAAADAGQVSALKDFGGWGYRARGDRSGIVLRSGPALSVRRASGRTLVVTVDDASTAAAALNALADRARSRTDEDDEN
ncbi:DUF1648 domain-containing protein [Streptomyces sp. NPDC002490]|uniref:DUF1648 domain-containing protein n=1 Tax=Streptomyces sp. NPDC002490 TaxID=3154416 RepID=UPI00331B3AA3